MNTTRLISAELPEWYSLGYQDGKISITVPRKIAQELKANMSGGSYLERYNCHPIATYLMVWFHRTFDIINRRNKSDLVMTVDLDPKADVINEIVKLCLISTLLRELMLLNDKAIERHVTSHRQLMHLEIFVDHEMKRPGMNFGIRLYVLEPAIKFIENHPDNNYGLMVRNSMYEAYWLNSQHCPGIEEFRAHTKNPDELYFIVPGQECDLIKSSSPVMGRAYCLTPHNLDDSTKMIALLAGIAKLWQIMRAN